MARGSDKARNVRAGDVNTTGLVAVKPPVQEAVVVESTDNTAEVERVASRDAVRAGRQALSVLYKPHADPDLEAAKRR